MEIWRDELLMIDMEILWQRIYQPFYMLCHLVAIALASLGFGTGIGVWDKPYQEVLPGLGIARRSCLSHVHQSSNFRWFRRDPRAKLYHIAWSTVSWLPSSAAKPLGTEGRAVAERGKGADEYQ